jgi:hypothetical protein
MKSACEGAHILITGHLLLKEAKALIKGGQQTALAK